GVLHLHRYSPGRQRVPSMSDHPEPADAVADRLDRPQHTLHRAPAELAVADVEHRVLLVAEVEGHLPAGVVAVGEEGADVRPQRVQSRLTDLVREAVTDLNPAAAHSLARVVVVRTDPDEVVVVAVAVEDDAPPPRHAADESGQVEGIALLQ